MDMIPTFQYYIGNSLVVIGLTLLVTGPLISLALIITGKLRI